MPARRNGSWSSPPTPSDPIFKNRSVAQLPCRLPDDIQQPCRAQVVTPEVEVLIADHIEQDHRPHPRQFVPALKLLDIAAAAVRIVRRARLAALVPFLAERLFTIEENKPVSEASLRFRRRHDASQFHQHGRR